MIALKSFSQYALSKHKDLCKEKLYLHLRTMHLSIKNKLTLIPLSPKFRPSYVTVTQFSCETLSYLQFTPFIIPR